MQSESAELFIHAAWEQVSIALILPVRQSILICPQLCMEQDASDSICTPSLNICTICV